MSLPSQSSRGMSRQSAVHTRRRPASPLRKAFPFLLILGVIALAWFMFRKPTPTNADPSNEQQIASGEQAGNRAQNPPQNPPAEGTLAGRGERSTSQPVGSDRPSRALPGSTPPDPQEEVDRAIAIPQVGSADPSGEGSRTLDPNTGSLLGNAAETVNRPAGSRGETGSSRAQPTQPVVSSDPSGIRLQLDTARRLIAENNRVEARTLLSQTLRNSSLSDSEANLIRTEITMLNEDLVFGPIVAPGDPMCEEYKIQSGDSLSRIAGRRELATHWKLIQRVNKISNPSRIRLGQRLKLVRGPFHAVVYKREHRMDIFHGSPDDPNTWIYIRSFRVGLGEENGTPVGRFVVNGTKLENPGWVNPRDSRDRYEADDPDNPIGEFWIGLDGLGPDAGKTGYGIHGTVEKESIGQNMSMGCVRLADADIALVYELLGMHVSRVEIRP